MSTENPQPGNEPETVERDPTAPTEKAQEERDATVDPMEGARRLLVGIEAQIRSGQTALARTIHEGTDHFHKGMQKATNGLTDANLDGWTTQSASMARLHGAASTVRPVDPNKK